MFPRCVYCSLTNSPDEIRPKIIRFGNFRRKSDSRVIARFRCLNCRRTFSNATLNRCFRQKKRTVNDILRQLLASGVSIRRSARLLRVNKGTVLRKLEFLGKNAHEALRLHRHLLTPKIREWQFDDMETFEHSKYKPLSITVAVEARSRFIAGFEVSQMTSKVRLQSKGRIGCGGRIDQRRHGRWRLFESLKDVILPCSIVTTDMNPYYSEDVKRFFPDCVHVLVRGSPSAKTGQGELKKIGFDPIFSINHTNAMFRANVNRLFRKTWCTTKKRQNLSYHLAIYAQYHNETLISRLAK